MKSAFMVVMAAAILLTGCVGRTGKIGKPIAAYYQPQLESLKLGVTTPEDLKALFTMSETDKGTRQTSPTTTVKSLASLKEARIENGKKVEIWQVAKGGNVDVAELLIWGVVSYNKDQLLQFRFEDGKLASYESVVIPDPVTAPVTPASKIAK
jgi:hypothetical protein